MILSQPVVADPVAEAAELAAISNVPGAVAGWTSADDREVAAAGLRVAGEPSRAADGDPWHVGSLTKSMTATLAARMVENGQITWSATIGEILGPEFPDMNPVWRNVTLETLLRHRSGLAANLGLFRTLWLWDGPRADYVSAMLASDPAGDAGEFLYSNAGYVVAGAMLEAAGDASWEDLIQAQVFAPLGIANARFGPPQGDVPEGHRTRLIGGSTSSGQGSLADNIPAMGPAGRVHLSADDMLIYLRAHLIRDETFLSLASWRLLQTPSGAENYALGWVSDGVSLEHSGSNTMWYAVAHINRETGLASFVAVNTGDGDLVEAPLVEAARRLSRSTE